MAMQDKLRRVQAIRKWLEKAEVSYTSHKEVKGEINLIMAQAEMQRLKETEPPHPLRVWGRRGLALLAAFCIVGGGVWIRYELKAHDARVTARAKAAVTKMLSQEKETAAEETKPIAEAPVAPSQTETAPEVVSVSPVVTESAAAAETAPVMSEAEIASVVGEASRALRGEF